jgi:hypothetical protein
MRGDTSRPAALRAVYTSEGEHSALFAQQVKAPQRRRVLERKLAHHLPRRLAQQPGRRHEAADGPAARAEPGQPEADAPPRFVRADGGELAFAPGVHGAQQALAQAGVVRRRAVEMGVTVQRQLVAARQRGVERTFHRRPRRRPAVIARHHQPGQRKIGHRAHRLPQPLALRPGVGRDIWIETHSAWPYSAAQTRSASFGALAAGQQPRVAVQQSHDQVPP